MKPRIKLTVGAVLFALVAMGAEDCAEVDESKPLNANKAAQQAPAEEEAEPDPPSPDGEYDLDCSYELGDFGESGDPAQGYRFTAGGTLVNTGNTDIRVRVTYKWKLLGRQPKTVRKTYMVREGQERDVNVTVFASDGDIDAHQNADADCSAKASIVETA